MNDSNNSGGRNTIFNLLKRLAFKRDQIETFEVPIADRWDCIMDANNRHHSLTIDDNLEHKALHLKLVTVDEHGTIDVSEYRFAVRNNGIIHELKKYEAYTLRSDIGSTSAVKNTLRGRGGETNRQGDEGVYLRSDKNIFAEVTDLLSRAVPQLQKER